MITRIVFERGLEWSDRPNAMRFDPPATTFGEVFVQCMQRYKVRPVLLMEQIPTGTSIVSHAESLRLFSLEGVHDVDVKCSRLMMGGLRPAIMQQQFNLAYVVNSVVYHCKRLAEVYSDIALDMVRIRTIPGSGDPTIVSFSNQQEPYFELDALLTSARRAYDASRYILWNVFGPKKRGLPSNFKKTLPECNKLPPELRKTLEESWQSYGEKLTDYRDCIIHYTPVDFGMGTATLQKLEGRVWSVLMRIPDNPEVKSQESFRFTKGLDALTYGWELTNEIVRVVTAISDAIPSNDD